VEHDKIEAGPMNAANTTLDRTLKGKTSCKDEQLNAVYGALSLTVPV
jgi:hypothetical protein